MTKVGLIYIMLAPGGAKKIGFDGNGHSEIQKYTSLNYSMIGVIRGSHDDEQELHRAFELYRDKKKHPGSKEHYDHPYVDTWIDKMFKQGVAVTSVGKLGGRKPFFQWSPGSLYRFPGFVNELIATSTIEDDDWWTPEDWLELINQALGGPPDLDPACSTEAYERLPKHLRPLYFYTANDDGTRLPWRTGGYPSRVFCNPPYRGPHSERDAARFTRKAADEIEAGNVSELLMLLNHQSYCTVWVTSFRRAVGELLYIPIDERIPFYKLKGDDKVVAGHQVYASSQNGSMFLYYGPHKQRVAKTFATKSCAYVPLLEDWAELTKPTLNGRAAKSDLISTKPRRRRLIMP